MIIEQSRVCQGIVFSAVVDTPPTLNAKLDQQESFRSVVKALFPEGRRISDVEVFVRGADVGRYGTHKMTVTVWDENAY